MANVQVAGSLIPGGVNIPLDARFRVANVADILSIENPAKGALIYCEADGKHYKITGLKSKTIGALTVENAAVDTYEEFGGSVPTGVAEHIADTTIHVTAEDKERWDKLTVYYDVTALNASGKIEIENKNIPIFLRSPGGEFYEVRGVDLSQDVTAGKFFIDPAAAMAALNIGSYSGTWRVYCAAGSGGSGSVITIDDNGYWAIDGVSTTTKAKGETGGSFAIALVDALPDTPAADTLYLVKEV